MSELEQRSLKGHVEVREGPDGPVIYGYGAVFNRDSADMGFIEQVDPAAFTKTLQRADVRGLGNHDANWLLGRTKSGTLRCRADGEGLYYEIDVNMDDPDGQRALAKVRRGDWDGSSFAFSTIRDEWDWAAQPPRRRLLEVALKDVGPVTYPAYPDSEAASRALNPLAERLGKPVEELVAAMRSGEIRSLLETNQPSKRERKPMRTKPERRALNDAAGAVAWGPEDGFCDLMSDVNEQLGGGAGGDDYGMTMVGQTQFCVDASVQLDKVLICDYDGDDYWVAPITMDGSGEPVLSDPTEWVSVEQGWIVTLDERALALVAEMRSGKTLSAKSLEALQTVHDSLSAAAASLRDLMTTAGSGAPLDSDVGQPADQGTTEDEISEGGRALDLRLAGLELRQRLATVEA